MKNHIIEISHDKRHWKTFMKYKSRKAAEDGLRNYVKREKSLNSLIKNLKRTKDFYGYFDNYYRIK